jgi:hypothetical protein
LAHLLYFSKNKTHNSMLHNPFLTLLLSIHFSCSCAFIAIFLYYSCTFISQFQMKMMMEHTCILCHKSNDLQADENNKLNEMLHQFSSCESSFKLKLSTFLYCRFWVSTYHYIYNISGCIHPQKKKVRSNKKGSKHG